MARSLILAFAFLSLPLASSTASEPKAMTLIWIDSYQLFPSTGLDRLRTNVEELFESHGMPVRLHVSTAGENLATIPSPRVHAVVMPSEPERWGLGPDAMAAAIGVRGGRYNIFVFYPALRRAVGLRASDLSPRDVADIARATARVLSHELVHVLAPELGHASGGLMARRLKRRELLSKVIELDEPSLRVARARLERWTADSPVLSTAKPPVTAIPMSPFPLPRL
jgi:hypothetical protein